MIFAIIGSIGLAFAPLLLTVREPVRKERAAPTRAEADNRPRSEEHTSELQSLMRISYAVFCLKKKKHHTNNRTNLMTPHDNSDNPKLLTSLTCPHTHNYHTSHIALQPLH